MVNYTANISRIKLLLAENTASSMTYAALECRLALEKICYDRLRLAHDYISHDELKKWQPKDVVQKLIQEVDSKIASEFTLSISEAPTDDRELSKEEFEQIKFIPVGTQIGFKPAKIGSLWNALSRVALHVHFPESSADNVNEYGDVESIRGKVMEALSEIKRISEGSLISTGVGPEVRFQCGCGHTNKRRQFSLNDGKVISCTKIGCDEEYTVRIKGADFHFERNYVEVECDCGHKSFLSRKPILNMPHEQPWKYVCKGCDNDVVYAWRLMRAKRPPQ